MAQARIDFADASGYERLMGRWSRAVCAHFLRWIEPPRGARWLDVGCGTGVLTEAVLDLCAPRSVSGIDPAGPQIEQAARGPAGARAKFQQADAMSLPFADGEFDVTASALVINFVPDPVRALAEMRRVTAPDGVVAGYVWEFTSEMSPSGPLRRAMHACGAQVPAIPGAGHSSLVALESLFRRAGMQSVRTTAVEVTLAYADFEDFWQAQTPGYMPTTKVIDAMSEGERQRLKRAVLETLPIGPNGKVEYAARANMVRGGVTS
jgi:ubiquinone/menaquinone biosynthesis C-methylase UbiE